MRKIRKCSSMLKCVAVLNLAVIPRVWIMRKKAYASGSVQALKPINIFNLTATNNKFTYNINTCFVLRIGGCRDSECDSMKSIISDVALWFLRINAHCVVAGWSLEVHYELSTFIAASVAEMRSWSSATLVFLAIFIAHLTCTIWIWILEVVAFSHTDRFVFDMSTFCAITGTLHDMQLTDCTGGSGYHFDRTNLVVWRNPNRLDWYWLESCHREQH